LAINYRLRITHLTVHHGKLVAFVHEPHLHGVSANHIKPARPALSTKNGKQQEQLAPRGD
jgi:hypothetical protein